eukprot:12641186-Alexandrium_andersonii.AAC.1
MAAKRWYTRVGQSSIVKHYLDVLATAESHQQPVPHLQAAAVYADLLGVPAKQRRAVFLHAGDCLFAPPPTMH